MTIRPVARPRLDVTGPTVAGTDEILTSEALDFLTDLHVRFSGRRHDLLLGRQHRRDAVLQRRRPATSCR